MTVCPGWCWRSGGPRLDLARGRHRVLTPPRDQRLGFFVGEIPDQVHQLARLCARSAVEPVPDGCGEPCDRRVVEQRAHVDLDAEPLADPGDEADRDQRVTAELEEAVLD